MSGRPFIGKQVTYTAPDTERKYRGEVVSWSVAGLWVDFGRNIGTVYFTWREANENIL